MTSPLQQTTLMPIDSAVTPQQIARVLPIRANLLPDEIVIHRNIRRVRIALIAAIVLTLAMLGLWYVYALREKSDADAALSTATSQVEAAQREKDKYKGITDTRDQQGVVKKQLATLVERDLPWATMLDRLRDNATSLNTKITAINSSLEQSAPGTPPTGVVAMVTITGNAPDKKTAANYVDALSKVPGLNNPYLTSASQADEDVDFSLTVEITSQALCGRHTTACKSGGN